MVGKEDKVGWATVAEGVWPALAEEELGGAEGN